MCTCNNMCKSCFSMPALVCFVHFYRPSPIKPSSFPFPLYYCNSSFFLSSLITPSPFLFPPLLYTPSPFSFPPLLPPPPSQFPPLSTPPSSHFLFYLTSSYPPLLTSYFYPPINPSVLLPPSPFLHPAPIYYFPTCPLGREVCLPSCVILGLLYIHRLTETNPRFLRTMSSKDLFLTAMVWSYHVCCAHVDLPTFVSCVCVYTCTVGSAQCSGCVVYDPSAMAAS